MAMIRILTIIRKRKILTIMAKRKILITTVKNNLTSMPKRKILTNMGKKRNLSTTMERHRYRHLSFLQGSNSVRIGRIPSCLPSMRRNRSLRWLKPTIRIGNEPLSSLETYLSKKRGLK
jgi:hypothetical protein